MAWTVEAVSAAITNIRSPTTTLRAETDLLHENRAPKPSATKMASDGARKSIALGKMGYHPMIEATSAKQPGRSKSAPLGHCLASRIAPQATNNPAHKATAIAGIAPN